MTPTVSIILPTFDRLEFLREAVASVRAQTVHEWELIVVDDGSTDGSVEWLEALVDERIKVYPRAHTGNLSEIRNFGVAAAQASWIAFLDSDDRWRPQKLERQLAYHADSPNHRWSYTGRCFIDGDGRELSPSLFHPWQAQAGWILRQILTHEANIALPSVLVERALILEAGGFDPESVAAEDYNLWLRLAERAECGVVDAELLEVRKHKRTTAQLPEVDMAFAEMFRQFAARTTDSELRDIARGSAVRHAVGATNRFGLQGEWSGAFRAFALACQLRPLAPPVGLAGLRLAWRRARAVF